MNPLTFPFDAQRTFWQQATESVETAQVAPDRIETLGNVEVGQTPSEVVYEENKLKLLHYESMTEEQHEVPILIVYALINRPYILDLQPDRSVVRRLLEAGHDVYLIDWGEPSAMDATLTLDDYVNRYIHNCVDEVCSRSDLDAINLLGYCMGGTMSVMYSALHPEKVRNLGLMAAGLCFDHSGGVLELWGDEDYYDPETVTDAFGNVPSEFLDIGFALMDPVNNFVSKYASLYDNLENEDFVENFARMERWLSDGIDVAGATYRQFLEDVYQENKLYKNELEVGDERVDLGNIDMPVLQLVGEYDHLIPPEASKPFNEKIASDDTEIMEYSTGHIGLSVSRSAHENLWPAAAEWFAEHSVVDETDTTDEGESVQTELVDEGETDSTPADEAPEAAEAATEAESTDESETATETEPAPEATTESEAAEPSESADGETGPEETETAGESAETETPDLEAIRGIGPAYASRLRETGIETPADLVDADVDALAAELDVGESRVRDWIAAADELTE